MIAFAYPALFKSRGGTSYAVTKMVICWCYAGTVGMVAFEGVPATIVWYKTLRDLVAPEPYTRPTEKEVKDGDKLLLIL